MTSGCGEAREDVADRGAVSSPARLRYDRDAARRGEEGGVMRLGIVVIPTPVAGGPSTAARAREIARRAETLEFAGLWATDALGKRSARWQPEGQDRQRGGTSQIRVQSRWM